MPQPDDLETTAEKVLYFVTPKDRAYKAWAIYKRRRKSKPFTLFRLDSIFDSREQCLRTAIGANGSNPEMEYSIQGAQDAAYLPDRYDP